MLASSYLHSPIKAAHNEVWLGCVVGVCGWGVVGVWLGCGWCVVGRNTMLASSFLHSPNKAAHNKVWLGCVVGVCDWGVWLGATQC